METTRAAACSIASRPYIPWSHIHAVVDFGVDAAVYLVDFWAQVRGVQLRRTRAVIFGPLGGEVQRHLRIVIGDNLTGGLLDYGGHRDTARVVRIPLEVGVTQKVDAQDRVDSTRVEIEGPAALVMGRPAKSQRQNIFQPEEPADDQRPICPGTGTCRNESIPPGFHGITITAVCGDPRVDVVGVPLELTGLDVFGVLRVLAHTSQSGTVRG